MNAISDDLAMSLIRQLSGLPGYPFHAEGEARIAQVLAETAISVGHARAIIARFDEAFPTPRGLIDAGVALRAQFEPPKPDPIEQWKAEGATRDPMFTETIVRKLTGAEFRDQLEGVHRQAIRDMLYYTEGAGRDEIHDRVFWGLARRNDLKKHGALVAEIRDEIAGIVRPKAIEQPRPNPYAAVAEAIANAQPIPIRCPRCNGTGHLAADEYCDCPMGVDLRKKEES